MSEEIKDSNDYSALMLVGKILSSLGWVIIVAAVVILIISIANEKIEPIVGALAAIPLGLSLVVMGQANSCFVSTERNTKDTKILLEEILKTLSNEKSDAKEDDHEKEGWVSRLDTMSRTEIETLIDNNHLIIINRFSKLNGLSEEEIKSRINDGTLKSVVIDNKIFLPSEQT